MKKLLLVVSIASTFAINAQAADIKFTPATSPTGVNVISIFGPIEAGDEKKFAQLAIQTDSAHVLLNSPGGIAVTGLEIGKLIKFKQFSTVALGDCTSACAIIWAGGNIRIIEKDARVGFHAAYRTDKNGQTSDHGGMNAMVGAYLNSVGFNDNGIYWASTAPANDVNWLTKEFATEANITVVWRGESTKVAPTKVAELAPGLVKQCYRGPGTIGSFSYSTKDRSKAVIVAEDPNRPTCDHPKGTGRGMLVRYVDR
jgi:hypothetical protein